MNKPQRLASMEAGEYLPPGNIDALKALGVNLNENPKSRKDYKYRKRYNRRKRLANKKGKNERR